MHLPWTGFEPLINRTVVRHANHSVIRPAWSLSNYNYFPFIRLCGNHDHWSCMMSIIIPGICLVFWLIWGGGGPDRDVLSIFCFEHSKSLFHHSDEKAYYSPSDNFPKARLAPSQSAEKSLLGGGGGWRLHCVAAGAKTTYRCISPMVTFDSLRVGSECRSQEHVQSVPVSWIKPCVLGWVNKIWSIDR